MVLLDVLSKIFAGKWRWRKDGEDGSPKNEYSSFIHDEDSFLRLTLMIPLLLIFSQVLRSEKIMHNSWA